METDRAKLPVQQLYHCPTPIPHLSKRGTTELKRAQDEGSDGGQGAREASAWKPVAAAGE
eukprot:591457-Rhodomonas_salina.2